MPTRVARPVVFLTASLLAFFSLLTVLDVLVPPFHDGRSLTRNQTSICSLTAVWAPGCNHFAAMNSYAAELRSADPPAGIASYPWQFWLDQKDIHYYELNRSLISGGNVVGVEKIVDYQGWINPIVLISGIAGILLCLFWAVRRRDDISFLVVAWTLGTWLPPEVFSVVDKRITYLYYMVVTMPALYIASARVLSLREVPRWAVGIWIGLALAAFAILYPLRYLNAG